MESETDRKEKIPSSSSLRASDDDDDEPIFVSPPGENPGGTVEAPPQAESGTVAEAVEAVRECYGDEGKELAEEVQGDAEPLGNQIGGDWLAFITAVFLGHRALNGKLPDKGTRYFVKTATGYRDNGGIPTTAARAYRKKLRDRREKEAEAQARQAEQAELARKQAAQHAVWRAEAEKKRAEKERQEQEDRIKRCLEYDAIVLPIRAEYDALTADELQPYRESAMATLTELFRLQNSQVVREQILKERMYARFLAKKGVQLPPMPVGYVPPAQRTGVLWMAPCPRREQSPARPEPAQGNI